MKHFFCKICCGIVCMVLLPLLFTLFMQGNGKSIEEDMEFLNTTETTEQAFDESLLPGIIANEISVDAQTEAMKAQAVIARTNCLRAIEQGTELPKGLTRGELLRLWGQEKFSEYYSQLESCAEATRGVAMTHQGKYIQADFHKVSAGYTRNAAEVYGNFEYPYLKSADSRLDIPSEDFLQVRFYTPREFVEIGEKYFPPEMAEKSASDILSKISVSRRDAAGYALEVCIDDKFYSGEEIRLTYDWDSAAFSIKEADGQIRVVTKGCGHGLGLSIYAAEALAKDGYSYREILEYFYAEISFVMLEDTR